MKKKPKLLFASTAAVHGESPRFPMRENDPLLPVSPYGAGKLGVENYAHVYCKTFGVPAFCIRFYPMYGPRQKKQVVFDLMRKLSSRDRVLTVIGTGEERRDFLYVEDAAEGVARILRKVRFDGGVVNLCTGRGVRIREVVNAVMGSLGIRKKVRYTKKLRKGDVDAMIGSTARLRKTGFVPRTSFVKGMQKTAEWFKQAFENK